MQTVSINTSKKYYVYIDKSFDENFPNIIKDTVFSKKILLVTDNAVKELYLDKVKAIFEGLGFEVFDFVFSSNEEQKTLSTVEKIYRTLFENDFTKGDTIVALGGGIVTDTAGFAGATFLRGINCIYFPTTLLSMVDACVGGKTAVNTYFGKNQIGVIRQPDAVFIATDTLKTLPNREFSCGAAEIIKTAMIKSENLFELLETKDFEDIKEDVISECIKIKASVVEEDEFDTSKRLILNFGHTIAHAIEKKSDYEIKHGEALAIGMSLITKRAVKNGLCDENTLIRLNMLLHKYSLSCGACCPVTELLPYIKRDKKNYLDNIKIALCEKIGQGYVKDFSYNDFVSFLTE